MIVGIGTDLTDIRRVAKTLERWGDRFVQRCFTEVEQARSDRRRQRAASYAKRWAAKEACSKALGTGLRMGVNWREIGRRQPGQRPAEHASHRRRRPAAAGPGSGRHGGAHPCDDHRRRSLCAGLRRHRGGAARRAPSRRTPPRRIPARRARRIERLPPPEPCLDSQSARLHIASTRREDPPRHGESGREEEGRRLGDDQDHLLGSGHRHALSLDPVPAVLDPLRLDEADASCRRLSVRLEIRLWLFAVLAALLAGLVRRADLERPARAGRRGRLQAPEEGRVQRGAVRVRRADRQRIPVSCRPDPADARPGRLRRLYQAGDRAAGRHDPDDRRRAAHQRASPSACSATRTSSSRRGWKARSCRWPAA